MRGDVQILEGVLRAGEVDPVWPLLLEVRAELLLQQVDGEGGDRRLLRPWARIGVRLVAARQNDSDSEISSC